MTDQPTQKLTEMLERTIEDHHNLLRISREEQEAVIRGDREQVESLTWKKQESAGALLHHLPHQQALLRDAARDLGQARTVCTLSELIEILPRGPTREHLRRQRDELRLLTQSLERSQRVTSRLLLRAIDYADASIRLLKQGPEVNPTYAAAGRVRKDAAERCLMDRLA